MCSTPGCARVAHARGLCQMHYDRTRKRQSGKRVPLSGREGEPPASPEGEPKAPAPGDSHPSSSAGQLACSVPGCDSLHHAKGYCKSHYSRLRRRGRITGGRATQMQVCEVAGCSKAVVRNRRCGEHLGDSVPGAARHMTKAERLAEIRRRHERMRREIERIRKTFDQEREEDG